MTANPRPSILPTAGNRSIIAGGIIALAVAMGIGRFAFTPLLPLMLQEGSLTAGQGAEWAAANYLGYFAGALSAGRIVGNPRNSLRLALAGVAITTLVIGAISGLQAGMIGAALRFASGVFSAWALVSTSSWCLAALAQRGVSGLGAWIYTGVGLGIALSGTFAWIGGWQPVGWLWNELGLIAFAGLVVVWWLQSQPSSLSMPSPSVVGSLPGTSANQAGPVGARAIGIVICYACFGFGYIIPATFLPAMARQQIADPLWFGLTWPLFGLASALSVGVAASFCSHWPRRRLWAAAQGIMAVGTLLPLYSQALPALALSACLVGGTFMVTTLAGLQLAREYQPGNPTRLLARMTAAFALGQIAGPLLVRALDGYTIAIMTASLLLIASAYWLWQSVPDPS